MNPLAGQLKKLHGLLESRKGQQDALQNGPKRIRTGEQAVQRVEAEIAACKEQLTVSQRGADQKNLAYKSAQQRQADFQVKLNQAGSNREFDILKGQLAQEIQAAESIEVEYLSFLEEIEGGRKRLLGLQERLEASRAALKKIQQEVAAEEPGIQARISELTGAIKEAESVVPSEVGDLYRRMVAVHGPGAMAPSESGCCSNCDVELSPQHSLEIDEGLAVLCRDCGRLLYSAQAS